MSCADCEVCTECGYCLTSDAHDETCATAPALADEAKARTRLRGPLCHIGRLLGELNLDTGFELQRVLADRTVSTAGIQRALAGRYGPKAPGVWSVGNHRRGKCRCNRKD